VSETTTTTETAKAGGREQWMPPLAQANAARATARRMRGEWLLLLADGVFTAEDLFREAATPQGRPLRRLTLKQVLSAQPDCSEERALKITRKICSTLRLDPAPPTRDLTVAWLLNPAAGGTRLLAYLDALHPRTIPWPGFPMTPHPAKQTRTSSTAAQPALPTYD